MKQLTLLRGGQREAEFLLDVQDAIVGRGRSAQIRLDENKMVSRQHCVVRRRGDLDQHVVEDLGGANGTFVNGFKVDIHVLRPGDRIVLGEDTLRYDFATRTATSLRDAPAVAAAPGGPTGTDSAEVEELSMEAVDVVTDLSEVREERRRTAPALHEDAGERTTVAGKDELERLLAEMALKKGPHLLVNAAGEERIVPLTDRGSVQVGHADGCAVRLPGWKLLGRVAATFVQQTGGWCLVPESPTWSPVRLGDEVLRRIRRLEHGDRVRIGRCELVYQRGEAF